MDIKEGFNQAFQCTDQLTDCALQASLGKCSYSPNTLANCPVSCGVSCLTAGGYLPEYNNYLNGGNPLLQSPLSSGAYRDIYSQQYSPQLPYNNAQLDNYNQNNDYNQNYLSTTTPNTFPFFCRDSHIFGCPNWAKLGFCQKVPEYMLNYCRESCGVCDNLMPFSSSTFKTSKTTLKNNFIPQGNLQFNSGGFGSVPPEPFGGISSNELLQEDNELLPYSHYYYSNSPLRTTLGGERKEKQQRLANERFQQNKLLFNEDDEQQVFPLSSSTGASDFITNLANSKPSQITSTQNSNVSKLMKMNDLLDKIN